MQITMPNSKHMTDTEILTKAINKVGIKTIVPNLEIEKWRVIHAMPDKIWLSVFAWSKDLSYFDAGTTFEIKKSVNDIIFSHDFAKAFWPNEKQKVWIKPSTFTTCNHREEINRKGYFVRRGRGMLWKRHLQAMVLCKNPIKYLEKFI